MSMIASLCQWISADTISGWLQVLLSSTIKTALLLAAAGLGALALRRSSAAARHLVWALSITGALLVPFLSVSLPSWQLFLLGQAVGVGSRRARRSPRLPRVSLPPSPGARAFPPACGFSPPGRWERSSSWR